jgi:hypothetical protein
MSLLAHMGRPGLESRFQIDRSTSVVAFGHGGECIAAPVQWRAMRGISRSAGFVRLADRKLRGLGAVLQILQKAQANTYDAAADVPPGDTLVDELLLLGRELVDTARDALRGAV